MTDHHNTNAELSHQVDDMSDEEFERAVEETREAMYGQTRQMCDWDAVRKEMREASIRILEQARERAKRNPD